MTTDAPKFPIVLTWHATGEVEEYRDERDLLCNLESLETTNDSHEVTAKDARGRVVRLLVDIARDVVEVEFAD